MSVMLQRNLLLPSSELIMEAEDSSQTGTHPPDYMFSHEFSASCSGCFFFNQGKNPLIIPKKTE
jgi:hypothetical protein